MKKRPQGKVCINCAYMEREEAHKQDTRIFCSNVRSKYCAEWVDPNGTCPLWVKWTSYTNYLNENTDRGL